jgi:predicted metal-dependent hydrolase
MILNEILATLEHNHSSRFWTHLRQFEPKTDAFHGQMRESWKRIPAWAHPIQIGGEEF